MNESKVEITDKDGWRKEYSLSKSILHIGSDPRNDIVLEGAHGAGVSPRHIQLISAPDASGYRLINVGNTDLWVGENGEKNLIPRSFTDIGPGERVRLGDFVLVFQGVGGAGGAFGRPALLGATGSIGLNLILPETELNPDQPIDGSIVVRNLGDKTGVQIKLEVTGLEPDMYELGPGPILFPNAEREVALRIQHPRRAKPPAGDLRFSLRATAPAAYPGDSASVNQVIRLLPFYTYKTRLVIPE